MRMCIIDGHRVPEFDADSRVLMDELRALATEFDMTSLSLEDQIKCTQAAPGLVLGVSFPPPLLFHYLLCPKVAVRVASRVFVDLLRNVPLFLQTPLANVRTFLDLSPRQERLRERVEKRFPLEPAARHHSLLHVDGGGGQHHRVLPHVEQDGVVGGEQAEGR
jgi:hypothetical protein